MGANNTGTVTQVAETEWKHISTFLEAVCKDVQEKARKELLKKIEERANAISSLYVAESCPFIRYDN